MILASLADKLKMLKDRKKQDKDTEKISLEDLIERERAALGPNTTKITLQSFLAWKKKKLQEKVRSRQPVCPAYP